MRIALVYCFPNLNRPVYDPLARRFAASYLEHPPGFTEHELHVISNGMEPGPGERRLFHPLPCHFHTHTNMGRDIGAFQMAAETIPCDLLICCGAHVHFHKAGWLDRLVEVYLHYGPGLYGPWGVMFQGGDHIRTTCFWMPPELLTSYPHWIGDGQRYAFERGEQSFTNFIRKAGFPAIMVSWYGAFPYGHWHIAERDECLVLDQWSSGERG